MSSALAQATTEPYSQISALLIHFLTTANALLETDVDAAKEHLGRAAALLDIHTATTPDAPSNRSRGGLAPWQAKRIAVYVESHLHNPIRACELAAHVALSTSHFFRAFKETYGIAPCTYIARRRISLSKRLMRNSHATLADIALECGLCDQSHFTRVFRRVAGMSPSLWRRHFVEK
jgi:AraC family transcriptional regulator